MQAKDIRSEITYEFLWSDSTPSEAAGAFRDMSFYFYARWNHWEFAMLQAGRTDPCVMADIAKTVPEKRRDIFEEEALEDFQTAFVRIKHDYGPEEFSASYMPAKEMKKLIETCILEYCKGDD